ncbi:MAG: hypothetical protein M1818_007798 [Claussenomyces sp. TS43310]|nr:MAG: hypothetical protein M1818_007798 [Claussenomyces sp. TS43310]
MGHLDPKQPPIKKRPYASILAIPYVYKIQLLLPKELYELVRDQLSTIFKSPRYSRVILSLSALVDGEFFNEYVKTGNVLMLSEGQHGVDNVYSMRNGLLTLALDKESYERAGLVGRPDGVKGKRGTRTRWIVEIDLRLPSMVHGKKAFDRMVYAFKNVLKSPVTWLFADLSSQAPSPDPMEAHFPNVVNCEPQISPNIKISMPRLEPPSDPGAPDDDDFGEHSVNLYEWLSLIALESPRVTIDDQIDAYLSRYAPPESRSAEPVIAEVVKVTWTGFISASWAHNVFVQTLIVATSKTWFAV